MKWHYKEILIDRTEAEKRIIALNFQEVNRGWELVFKDKSGRRIHIIPTAEYMEIHQDNIDSENHRVVKNRKATARCESIIRRLNKHNKIEVFLKRILKRLTYS